MNWDDHKGKVPQPLLNAHRDLATIGVNRNVDEGYLRIVGIMEMRNRGVRFLPSQVIKRALRRLKYSKASARS